MRLCWQPLPHVRRRPLQCHGSFLSLTNLLQPHALSTNEKILDASSPKMTKKYYQTLIPDWNDTNTKKPTVCLQTKRSQQPNDQQKNRQQRNEKPKKKPTVQRQTKRTQRCNDKQKQPDGATTNKNTSKTQRRTQNYQWHNDPQRTPLHTDIANLHHKPSSPTVITDPHINSPIKITNQITHQLNIKSPMKTPHENTPWKHYSENNGRELQTNTPNQKTTRQKKQTQRKTTKHTSRKKNTHTHQDKKQHTSRQKTTHIKKKRKQHAVKNENT